MGNIRNVTAAWSHPCWALPKGYLCGRLGTGSLGLFPVCQGGRFLGRQPWLWLCLQDQEQDQVLCLERCCTKLLGQKQEWDKHGTSSPRGQQPSGEEIGTGSTLLPHPSCSLLVSTRLLTQRTINHGFLGVFCSHMGVSRKGPAHLSLWRQRRAKLSNQGQRVGTSGVSPYLFPGIWGVSSNSQTFFELFQGTIPSCLCGAQLGCVPCPQTTTESG